MTIVVQIRSVLFMVVTEIGRITELTLLMVQKEIIARLKIVIIKFLTIVYIWVMVKKVNAHSSELSNAVNAISSENRQARMKESWTISHLVKKIE